MRFLKTISRTVTLVLALTGCVPQGGGSESLRASADPAGRPVVTGGTAVPSPTAVERSAMKVTVAAVGDVLVHGAVYRDALQYGGGVRYDFDPMFAAVAPMLRSADVAFANQESVIGGQSIGLSDYPRFNSPFELGDALRRAGVDVVSMANNHALDRGVEALRTAWNYWRGLGICPAGVAFDDAGDGSCLLEIGGMRIALLAYTYGTNGIPQPADQPDLVRQIDVGRIRADVAAAEKRADAVVVSFHFGDEYQTFPNEQQKAVVREAVAAGADAVIGHHPHVLQPIERLTGREGESAVVAYSLGNFLAAQERNMPERRTGGVLLFDLVRSPSGKVRAENVGFLPTYILHDNWRQFRIVPLADALGDASLRDGRAYAERVRRHVSQWFPELRVFDRIPEKQP